MKYMNIKLFEDWIYNNYTVPDTINHYKNKTTYKIVFGKIFDILYKYYLDAYNNKNKKVNKKINIYDKCDINLTFIKNDISYEIEYMDIRFNTNRKLSNTIYSSFYINKNETPLNNQEFLEKYAYKVIEYITDDIERVYNKYYYTNNDIIKNIKHILQKHNIEYKTYSAKTLSYYISFESTTIRISDHHGNERNNLTNILMDLSEGYYENNFFEKIEQKILNYIKLI